jgi:hypothetical protein
MNEEKELPRNGYGGQAKVTKVEKLRNHENAPVK